MRVQMLVSAEIFAAPERVFDLAVDNDNCQRFFRRWGPIPGVVHCEALTEKGADRPRRKLKLSDGSTCEEEIFVQERPHSYRYRWLTLPAAPLDFVVRGAEAHWAFQPTQAGGHTRVVWTYHFELTSPLVYPLALVLRVLFRRWMAEALERLRQASTSVSSESLDTTRSPAS